MTCTSFCLVLSFFLSVLVAVTAVTPPVPVTLSLRHKFYDGNLSDHGYYNYLRSRIRGDVSRRKWVTAKMNNTSLSFSSSLVVGKGTDQELAVSIPLGTPFEEGEYLITADIGTQPRRLHFLIDSGSDVAWQQCLPCISCYNQDEEIYDPSLSKSSQDVAWDDELCMLLDWKRKGLSDECIYKLEYGNGAKTRGYLTRDQIRLSSEDGAQTYTGIIPIGCGFKQTKMNYRHAGILPLSTGPLSLVTTLNLVSFSYCLVSPNNLEARSTLVLNDSAPTVASERLHLLRVEPSDTFLYVNLIGISVNNVRVEIPEGTFTIQDDGECGVILDSGSMLTYLTREAYTRLRDMFEAETEAFVTEDPRELPKEEAGYELCFDVSDIPYDPYPSVTFHFAGLDMPLPRDSYVEIIDETTECFSILPEDEGEMVSIIGSISNMVLGFTLILSRISLPFIRLITTCHLHPMKPG